MAGAEKWEVRRRVFREKVREIYVYVPTPYQLVVGKFKLGKILSGDPSKIWNITKGKNGLKREAFEKRFEDRQKIYALEIGDVRLYRDPLFPKKDVPRFVEPRPFYYIGGYLESYLRRPTVAPTFENVALVRLPSEEGGVPYEVMGKRIPYKLRLRRPITCRGCGRSLHSYESRAKGICYSCERKAIKNTRMAARPINRVAQEREY